MKIHSITLWPYRIPMTTGSIRYGVWVYILDTQGNDGWGEVAPLPRWSRETLEQALQQLKKIEPALLEIDWTESNCLQELSRLALYPSVSFGIESALLSILAPLPPCAVTMSALLMGSPEEIFRNAELRSAEGFSSAKLKVSQLSFEDAAFVIDRLKDRFRLRIDVNRAWKTEEALRFFSQYPKETFDYVEEPFQNPHDLALFTHPLAVDESYPQDLSLEELETFPTLKAMIYKPTIQGGWVGCIPLQAWAKKRGIEIVLSSSFESDLGLMNIASLAYRLHLQLPIGIGTYHYMNKMLAVPAFPLFKIEKICDNTLL